MLLIPSWSATSAAIRKTFSRWFAGRSATAATWRRFSARPSRVRARAMP